MFYCLSYPCSIFNTGEAYLNLTISFLIFWLTWQMPSETRQHCVIKMKVRNKHYQISDVIPTYFSGTPSTSGRRIGLLCICLSDIFSSIFQRRKSSKNNINIYRMFQNKDLMYTLVCWKHKKYIHENWVQEKQMRFCKYASGIHQ